MKKGTKLLLGGVVLIALMAAMYRFVNKAPSAELAPAEQVLEVMTDGGCLFCHSKDADLPFYADFPVAKQFIGDHVRKGYASFDVKPFMDALRDGKAPHEVDLAKVEQSVAKGTMPLMSYYLAHWGSSITSEKRDMMLAAFKKLRADFYPNTLAAAEFANEAVRPIPDVFPHNVDKAVLGKELYHDTRLSADGTISCATCHGVETAGVDNLRYSSGINGQLGGVNAPTSYNACFNFVQFWDGRAATLADQAAGPPLNPVEMGCASFDEIVERLAQDKEFTDRFTAVYPEGLSQSSITDAIAEYEKTLITPNSPFDRYLKGEQDAMTAEQIEGYEIFKDYSCATCHVGENMGGLSYELMGQRANYFEDRELTLKSGLTDGDNGRWAQTKDERDRYRFKTPSLRNVALTWPYYHDGSVETLDEAVSMMAKYQVGREMSQAEIEKVVSYMNALTGEYQGKLLTNTNSR